MYIVFDGINGEHEHFDKIEDAQKYLEETVLDRDEGYHPDLTSCGIFKLAQKLDYDVIARRDDFTEQEWEDEGYASHYEEIWKHKFVDVGGEEKKRATSN